MIIEGKKFFEIVDCPNWFVNEEGRVWSSKVNRYLVPHNSGTGYLQLIYQVRKEKIRQKHFIHRLVTEVFIGKIEDGLCVNHKDGNKHNNHVRNLEIVTRKENNHHARATGLMISKLSKEQALEIKNRAMNLENHKSIAVDYGIHPSLVSKIKLGEVWNEI